MDAILFLHFLPLYEPVSRKHLALIRALNPDAEVIPLKFDEDRETPEWRWQNADLLALEWFDRVQPKHERIFILEADTFCSQSLREFYGASYDKSAVGSLIVHPWSNAEMPGEHGTMRGWEWFSMSDSAELYPYLRGMVPLCGCMFRHDVFFNMVQQWRTNRALFDPLMSELRMGTLAAMCGFEPTPIRTDCHQYISFKDVQIDRGPGVFHRVNY